MFISVMVGLIVINIIYSMVPDLSYNKYLKTSIGVVVIVFAVAGVMNIKINDNLFDYNTDDVVREKNDYIETVNKQIEADIEKKITEKLIENKIETVVFDRNGYLYHVAEKEEIIKLLSETYNLTKERINFVE